MDAYYNGSHLLLISVAPENVVVIVAQVMPLTMFFDCAFLLDDLVHYFTGAAAADA